MSLMFSEANTRSCERFSETKMEGMLLEIFMFYDISGLCVYIFENILL